MYRRTTPTPSILCPEQALRFDLVFLAGLLAVFIPTPLLGWVLDTFGARICSALSAVLVLCGYILFAFGYETTKLDLLAPALGLVACGGMGLTTSLFALAKILSKYTTFVFALYSIAFDSSPIVFYIYVKLYQSFGITPRLFFLVLTVFPLLILLLCIFWPKGYGEPIEKHHHENPESSPQHELELSEIPLDGAPSPKQSGSGSISASHESSDGVQVPLEKGVDLEDEAPRLVFDEEGDDAIFTHPSHVAETVCEEHEQHHAKEEVLEANAAQHEETSEFGSTALFHMPFTQQARTREFIFLGLFHFVFTYWLSTYMGSIQSRLKGIDPTNNSPELKEKIESFTETFGLVLSLAFLSAPVVGYALYRLKLLRSIWVCNALAILWCLEQFLPSINLQLITFVTFAILRAWYYSIIFNIITQLFGWANVGKIWGTYSAISGFISFSFYGVSWAVVNVLHDSYLIPNLITLALFLLTTLFGLFLTNRKRAYDASLSLDSAPRQDS